MPRYWRVLAPILLAVLVAGQEEPVASAATEPPANWATLSVSDTTTGSAPYDSSSVPYDSSTVEQGTTGTGTTTTTTDQAQYQDVMNQVASATTDGDGVLDLNELFGTTDASYNSEYDNMAAQVVEVPPPEITMFQCNAGTVDVSISDQTVQCVASAVSQGAPISFISGTFYTPDKAKRIPVVFTQVNLIGGTAQAGTYTTNIVVPMAADEAVWTLGYNDTAFEGLAIGDADGRVHVYDQAEAVLKINPFNPGLKVTSYTGPPLAYAQAQIRTSSGIKVKNMTCWDPSVLTPSFSGRKAQVGTFGTYTQSTVGANTQAAAASGGILSGASGMAAATVPATIDVAALMATSLSQPLRITPTMKSREIACSVFVKLDAAGLGYVDTYFVSDSKKTAFNLRFAPTETTEFYTEGETVYARMNNTLTIPYWAESGKYSLALSGGYQGATVSRAGTLRAISSKDVLFPPSFTLLTSSQDIKPPKIQSFYCSPSGAIKVTQTASSKIVCNVKADEDISGINYLAMQFVSPSKDQFMNFAYIPFSQGLGDFKSEPVLTLKAQQSVDLPGGSEPGVWALVRAVAADNAGNYKAYHVNDFENKEVKGFFVVENSLIGFAFDPIDAGAVVIKPDEPQTQSAAGTVSVSSLTLLLTTLLMVRLSRLH